MAYLGSYIVGDSLLFTVNTHNNKGASADALSVPTYTVYRNETQTAMFSGSMAKLDDAATTGFYSEILGLTGAFTPGLYSIYASANVGNVIGTISYTFTLTTGTSATVDANIVQISGDATAADNLELQFDGTGLSGDNYPSTQAQILNIAIAGSPSYEAASSYVLSTGTQSAGTYLNTDTSNSVYHTHTDNGGLLDLYYEFTLSGDEVATSVVFKGRINGINDSVSVQAYDWTSSTWLTLFTLAGTAGSTDTNQNPALVGKYTGTGLNDGKVRVRIVNAVTLTSATLYVDQLIVGKTITSRTVGYQDGAVWVKATGNSGTANFINGTADNPCPWADAQTIATSLGLTRFRIVNGETLTLTGATEDKALIGRSWTLLLNGQSISGSYIEGASIFGICSGGVRATFIECDLLAGTFPPSKFLRCGVGSSGTFAAASAGNYDFVDCYSLVPGAGTPVFTFSGLGSATGIQFRRWSGGTNITLDSNCTMSVESVSAGTQTVVTGGANSEYRGIFKGFSITSSGTSITNIRGVIGPLTIAGTAGTVTIAGVCGTVTDSSGGAVTITNTAVNLPNINTEADTALTDYDPPTNAEMIARTLLAADYVIVSDTIAAVTTVNGLANDVITAASIATNAIDSDALDATAITEIQSGLATSTAVSNIQTDTDDIQTRLPAALVGGRMDSSVGAMAANVITSSALDTTAVTEIAEAILKLDWTTVTGEAARSMLNALRFLRNKWSVAAGVLTVTEEDDATPAWTSTISADATADPIIGSDPA